MFLSSIFNFESCEGLRARVPKTLLFVAGVVLLLEITVRVVPESALMPAKSRRGEIDFVEREGLPKLGKIETVVLGSSRMRRAVVPKQFDEAMGLPAGSTLNAGFAMGRIYEALYFYERNEARLKDAKLVVLGIDEWHLSAGWKIGSTYELHAPLKERFEMPERLRTSLVLDGILQIRQKLKLLPKGLLVATGLKKRDKPGLFIDEQNHILPLRTRGVPADVDARAYHETVDNFYSNFEITDVFQRHIEQLAARVRANGGRLVLMQLPNREAYQREVQKLKPKEYAEHLNALKRTSVRAGVPLFIYEAPADLGLSDADFEDYGHMNGEGAKKFTAFLAEMAKREGWLGK
jgi:hypothetical protein